MALGDVLSDDLAVVAYGDRLSRQLSTLHQYIVIPCEPEEVDCLVGIRLVHKAVDGTEFEGELVEVQKR